ncbi:MAG: rhodanese-like domain-containing protein [Erysipelotrichaceae bacterium]
MKKIIVLWMALMILSGCAPQVSITGVVDSFGVSNYVVSFSKDNDFDLASVSVDRMNPDIARGDLIEIYYDGVVAESYPVQIRASKVKQKIDFSQEPAYRTISFEDAKLVMELKSVMLLDVRTAQEYQEKHLEGATNIPLDELTERIENEVWDKNEILIVYCRSGNRSQQAATQLVELGYRNVFDFGSIDNWKEN